MAKMRRHPAARASEVNQRRTMEIGERLPDLSLETGSAARAVGLRTPGSGAAVLLLPPVAEVESDYVRAFLDAAADVAVWDASPLVVAGSAEERAALQAALGNGDSRLAVDASGTLRRKLGLDDRSWGLFIADRWGVLYHAVVARSAAELPQVGEIREWAKFLATQCPECGVIDEPPTGRWNPP